MKSSTHCGLKQNAATNHYLGANLVVERDVTSVFVIPHKNVGIDSEPSARDVGEESHGTVALHSGKLIDQLGRKRNAPHRTHLAHDSVGRRVVSILRDEEKL